MSDTLDGFHPIKLESLAKCPSEVISMDNDPCLEQFFYAPVDICSALIDTVVLKQI